MVLFVIYIVLFFLLLSSSLSTTTFVSSFVVVVHHRPTKTTSLSRYFSSRSTILRSSSKRRRHRTTTTTGRCRSVSSSTNEYSILEDEEVQEQSNQSAKRTFTSANEARVEYGALFPGSAVRIQVGDQSTSRKAWKKRRRSGSPLLVPCSITSLGGSSRNDDNDGRRHRQRWHYQYQTTVRQNVLYVLYKYGMPLSTSEEEEIMEHVGLVVSTTSQNRKDIGISLSTMTKRYRNVFGTSLTKHAKELGYDTVSSLLQDLFNRQEQKQIGVRLFSYYDCQQQQQSSSASSSAAVESSSNDKEDDDDSSSKTTKMWLMAPITKHRGRRIVSRVGLLQFVLVNSSTSDADADAASNDDDDNNNATRMTTTNDDNVINSQDNNDDVDSTDTTHLQLQHTGYLRIRHRSSDGGGKSCPYYDIVPLSVALRVSQEEYNSGIIQSGSVHNAVVLSLDDLGDGGFPLLTLSLRRTSGQYAERTKQKIAAKRHFGTVQQQQQTRLQLLGEKNRKFDELHVGDGPITARVIRLLETSAEALVDCGVGRTTTKHGTNTRVLGVLRFDDIVQSALKDNDDDSSIQGNTVMSEKDTEGGEDVDEDDATIVEDDADDEQEEEEVDLSHFVSMEGGVMTYNDPETEEDVVLSDSSIQDEEEYEDSDEDEDDLFISMSPEERLDLISTIMNERREKVNGESDTIVDSKIVNEKGKSPSHASSTSTDAFQPSFVQVGDELEVYIKSVFKQSGRFVVTLDSAVKGRKAKDIKRESEAEKKLARLAKQMGGSLDPILELEGREYDGVVQAISNTGGDWCYVKPSIDSIPVGIAKVASDIRVTLSKGDTVRVRMEGIDEARGQLAMSVISIDD